MLALGRCALEHRRVHDHVEADRQQRQERRDEVHEDREHRQGNDAQEDAERQRLLRFDRVRRQRPAPVPGHEQVDVPVEVLVDGVRAACRQRAPDQRPEHQHAPARPVHAGQGARGQDHR